MPKGVEHETSSRVGNFRSSVESLMPKGVEHPPIRGANSINERC